MKRTLTMVGGILCLVLGFWFASRGLSAGGSALVQGSPTGIAPGSDRSSSPPAPLDGMAGEVPADEVTPPTAMGTFSVPSATMRCPAPEMLTPPVAADFYTTPGEPSPTVTDGELSLRVPPDQAASGLLVSADWDGTSPLVEASWEAAPNGGSGTCTTAPVDIGPLRLHVDLVPEDYDKVVLEGCVPPGMLERPIELDGLEVRRTRVEPCEMRLVVQLDGRIGEGAWVEVDPVAGEWVDVVVPTPADGDFRSMTTEELLVIEAEIAERKEMEAVLMRMQDDVARARRGEGLEDVVFFVDPDELAEEIPAQLEVVEEQIDAAVDRADAGWDVREAEAEHRAP